MSASFVPISTCSAESISITGIALPTVTFTIVVVIISDTDVSAIFDTIIVNWVQVSQLASSSLWNSSLKIASATTSTTTTTSDGHNVASIT